MSNVGNFIFIQFNICIIRGFLLMVQKEIGARRSYHICWTGDPCDHCECSKKNKAIYKVHNFVVVFEAFHRTTWSLWEVYRCHGVVDVQISISLNTLGCSHPCWRLFSTLETVADETERSIYPVAVQKLEKIMWCNWKLQNSHWMKPVVRLLCQRPFPRSRWTIIFTLQVWL